MMKTTYIFVLVLSICAPIAQSQSIDTIWTRVYGRGYYDTTGWVEETSDHGFIMTFGSQIMGNNQLDLCYTKTNSLGDTLWTKTIINRRHEIGHHITQTDDGGFLISAETTPDSSSFQARAWILKTDSSGDTIWTYMYGGNGSHVYYGIQTLDSGYAAVGQTYPSGQFSDVLIIKLNSSGQPEWSHTYGDGDYQIASYVGQTSDSGYVIGGYSRHAFVTEQDFWVIRLDKTGATLWDSLYIPTNGSDLLFSGCQAGNDGFVFTGRTGSSAYVLRIDSLGNTVWARTYYPFSGGWFNSVAPTTDGGFILGGSQEIVSLGREYWLMKIDGGGDSLWSFTCGRYNDDHGRCVAQAFDGNYVILGNSSAFGQTNPYLVKVGEVENAIDNDIPSIPRDLGLLSNYPNPFNSSTIITVDGIDKAELGIYDITGKLIMTLATSGGQIIWDAEGYASGIYFCKLKNDSSGQTRKMVLIR